MRRKRKCFIYPETFVSPPLPLIKLPPECRAAKTGWPTRLHILPHINLLTQMDETIEPIYTTRCKTAPENLQKESQKEGNLNNEIGNDSSFLQLPDLCSVDITRVVVYTYPTVMKEPLEKYPDTLVFNSQFESGNLARVDRILNEPEEIVTNTSDLSSHIYECIIQPDLNNSAYRQWFYFSIKNATPGRSYTFSLVNLNKSNSLFAAGQQPVVYSKKRAASKQVGWSHDCRQVTYQPTCSLAEGAQGNTLSFTYDCNEVDDTVYFACLPPYTYTGT